MINEVLGKASSGSLAGVDEAGRGAIAGPVVAAAVILGVDDKAKFHDSKQLSGKKRIDLYKSLRTSRANIGIGLATPYEIENLNIHYATLLAMKRALEKLKMVPEKVLVDGKFCPDFDGQINSVIKGDQCIRAISAASIVAKVFRDHLMLRLDRRFPNYKFAVHKGYPTKKHLLAIREFGVLPFHRKSYKPIRLILGTGTE